MSLSKTISGYAKLSRISNLPTCLSNVMVGFALGSLFLGGVFDWFMVLLLFKCVGMIYVGGMAMNDVFDLGFDREHGIDRPIVKGEVSYSGAIIYMIGMLGGGLFLTHLHFGLTVLCVAAGLVLMITSYTYFHKRKSWSVYLMGGCRSLVYVLGMMASVAVSGCVEKEMGGVVWLFVAGIGLYTAGITLVARMEHLEGALGQKKKWATWGMIILGVSSMLIRLQVGWADGVVGMVLVFGLSAFVFYWLKRASSFAVLGGPKTRNAVMTWLSGMALIDALVLFSLGNLVAGGVAIGCFITVVLWHKVVAGT